MFVQDPNSLEIRITTLNLKKLNDFFLNTICRVQQWLSK